MLDQLFESYTRERQFIKNVSQTTLVWYKATWRAVRPHLPREANALTPQILKTCMIALRSEQRSAITVNTYLRVVNSFSGWLHEEGHMQVLLRAPKLMEERRIARTFTREQIKRFVRYQPKDAIEQRAHVLGCLLADTGIRIKEALGLKRADVDLQTMLLTVFGKGRKDRTIPFSISMRKILFRWLQTHEHSWVFATRNDTALGYHNALRDLQVITTSLGIVGTRTSFHTFRHTFGTNYIKQGGNVFMLQRVLGHSSLEMTKRYVTLQTSDLQAAHEHLSLLRG
jgi:integrase/recombinase XerD